MAETKFIYFDLGNVITFFDHEKGCSQIAEVAGTTTEKVQEVLFTGDLQSRYETGAISCEEFYKEFCNSTGTSGDFDKLLVAGSDIFRMNVRMFPVIGQLRAVCFPIGVLSNTCKAHWDFVCNSFQFVGKAMSQHILSYESRSKKPDPKIYRDAIAAAGCAPEEILFTDDLPENIEGALACGLDAVLFTSAAEFHEELVTRSIEINL